MRVVLDTNVIISAYLSPDGHPGAIVSSFREGVLEVVVSPHLLTEYRAALGYDRARRRHGMTPEQIGAEVDRMRELAILATPSEVPRMVAADPDDDHVIACAEAGAVDFIVSGDRHLLELRACAGIRILSPAAFVALLESGLQSRFGPQSFRPPADKRLRRGPRVDLSFSGRWSTGTETSL